LQHSQTKWKKNGLEKRSTYKIPKRNLEGGYWLDSNCGYNIIQAHSDILVNEKEKITYDYHAQLKQFGDKWFPQKIHCISKRNDKVLIEETIDVEEARFNQNIPDKIFTMEGLELPLGTKFWGTNDKGIGTVVYWNGKQLSKTFINTEVPQQYRPSRKWVFIGNVIFLTLLALHFWRKYRISSQKNI
jgi:hypothetical protein